MSVAFITGFYITRLGFFIYKNNEFTKTFNILKAISYTILFCGNVTLYLILRQSYIISEPYIAAIGGIALALLLGKSSVLEKINQTPKILENLYNNIAPQVYDKITLGLNFVDNKILSNYKLILFLSKLPVKTVNWIEVNIMNKSVSLISSISKVCSRCNILLQQGNVQTYNAYAFIIVTVILTLVVVGYIMIFGGG